jgi:hypothetical protein
MATKSRSREMPSDPIANALLAKILDLQEELEAFRKANTTGPLAEAEIKKAEDVLIAKGQSLTHDEIRRLLQKEGITEPAINFVISRIVTVMKKVKSGSVLTWK